MNAISSDIEEPELLRIGDFELVKPSFKKTQDGRALCFGKVYELDADPDDAIRARSRISQLTRDRQIEGGTELKAQSDATTTSRIQSELTVLPQT